MNCLAVVVYWRCDHHTKYSDAGVVCALAWYFVLSLPSLLRIESLILRVVWGAAGEEVGGDDQEDEDEDVGEVRGENCGRQLLLK